MKKYFKELFKKINNSYFLFFGFVTRSIMFLIKFNKKKEKSDLTKIMSLMKYNNKYSHENIKNLTAAAHYIVFDRVRFKYN